ncbi:MAG: hypothetical protein H6671_18130 [Anaerolineaceae bacterium]|nr:hypothetical protein [Anaerolineaceae bacterium]MCB9457904.1 hypothetical protein [Anaerolineaceae bacterium]
MLQKLMVGIFIVAVLGLIAYSVYDASQSLATSTVVADTPVAAVGQATHQATNAGTGAGVANAGTGVGVANPEVTAQPIQQQLQLSTENVGDIWQATGTITVLDDFGMTIATDTGEFYVELGPPTYWQAQGVPLAVGNVVTVDGFNNEGQIHARVVTMGELQLVVRTEDGQPLWSGGVDNAGGANHTITVDGTTQPNIGENEFQVAADDWVTLTGIVNTVSNGGLTIQTPEGDVLTFQLGRPDFWQSQEVTLLPGDPVEILGFWSGTQFMVGDITKTATGEHIILRDPNGRQLWGGPGRSGNSNGQANRQGNGS